MVMVALSGVGASSAQTISDLKPIADRIATEAKSDNRAYTKLTELCDDIGHRLTGSENYDRAVDWAVRTMKQDRHENVRAERVMAPKWTRGRESLRMLEPFECDLPMLGLGMSVGTPPEGITAEVLVVSGDEDLQSRTGDAVGKIVLFNVPMSRDDEELGAGYGPAVRYRGLAPTLAVRHGAVAALVRSVTTRSLQSPHTGATGYANAPRPIPAAAVSTEIADQFARYQARGIPIRVQLKMEARTETEFVPVANVVGELVGREKPEEIVIISGHLDSWDVGQGAQDDGGGCVTAMEALTLLRKLDLRPRRTIRVVLWANEENGTYGARDYVKTHAEQLGRHVVAIESDSGLAALRAFVVDAKDEAQKALAVERVREIVALMPGAGNIKVETGGAGADIARLKDAGVTLIGQESDMTHYFDVHHTHADTVSTVSPADLTDHVAAMAILAYAAAELPQPLGRQEDPGGARE